ncbi:MAG: HD domain-containing protein [Alphaproteobacteria bacterium]|nr:HD domain-containing protein [Alphaproteobacteria bacterium]
MQIYMVGGAVRDMVLGKEPHDRDYVVVGATPQEMTALGYICVGKQFPVFLHPVSKEEYALARKEIKTGPKHTDFKFVFDCLVTLAEDLQRRDFTCNALVYDQLLQKVEDYVGGLRDIEQRTLRHINSEHFVEDPLRILRMCRFAAQLNFSVAPETMALVQQMVKENMLQYLSSERIWQEFYKAMKAGCFAQFILMMRECGALQKLLPEIEKLWQTPEICEYHPEGNSGAHTILTVEQGANFAPEIQFALLLHDVGKSQTPEDILPHHYQHDWRGFELVKKICKRLNAPKKFMFMAMVAARYHMRFFAVPQMRRGKLRDFLAELTHDFRDKNALDGLMQICRCDMYGRAEIPSDDELACYEQACQRCENVWNVLSKLKATDMPNFAQLPKNADFFAKWREFQIQKINNL